MKFKIYLCAIGVLLGCLNLEAYGQHNHNSLGIIPQPAKQKLIKGHFSFTAGYSIEAKDAHLDDLIPFFNSKINKLTSGKINSLPQKANILLVLDSRVKGGSEAYKIRVEKNKIEIRAYGKPGIFYGLQTLLQLCFKAQQDDIDNISIPCCYIYDAPRFTWRGFMLDESRHFFGVRKVKQLIDIMAFHKMNRFHWHLTDAPGWRIEIKKYPKLTSVGSIGCHSDSTAPAAYYTQEQIREIIKYASDRFVTIIPEIDMPGHASAAVRAYPQFSGGGSKKHPDFTFHPAKQETYDFLEDILTEVVNIFPSQWLHIGMDEVHFGNKKWASFPEVKALMKNQGIDNLKGVERYFSHRMDTIVQRLGKTTTGWDEIVSHELPTDHSLIMWWRHDHPEVLKKALQSGYQTILCPRIPCYFDFVQHESHKNGRRWRGNFCDLEKVYEYPVLAQSITKKQKKNIKGIQANVWTERFKNESQLDFIIFPRISAFSESAWSLKKNKSFPDFKSRMKWMYRFYELEGINFFDYNNPARTPEPSH